MQQPPIIQKTIIFKQYKVPTHKEDMVTTPFIFNKWVTKPDTTWVTPATIFYTRVLGGALVAEEEFMAKMKEIKRRMTTMSEKKHLEKIAFITTPHKDIFMVEVGKLADVLEGFNKMGQAATVAFLRGMPPVEGSSSNKVDSMFPDSIPTCNITPGQLEGAYCISSIAPTLCKAGSKWGKQVAALEKWKANPPLNSHGRVKRVGATSIQLMVRSLEEYMGFCHKHLEMEPSMDLLMDCNSFSKFMAFKVARDNESSTLLRSAQQVSLAMAFAMSGHCPHAKEYSSAHAAQCKQWYSNLKAVYRAEVDLKPSKRADISLASQWEAVDADWAEFEDCYEVRVLAHHAWGWMLVYVSRCGW